MACSTRERNTRDGAEQFVLQRSAEVPIDRSRQSAQCVALLREVKEGGRVKQKEGEGRWKKGK